MELNKLLVGLTPFTKVKSTYIEIKENGNI